MLIALDIGNSQIYGGVFEKDKLKFSFRKTSRAQNSSDEMGVFLRSVIRENNLDPREIGSFAICSVVPDMVHTARNCAIKYFGTEPFILGPGSKTGLNIKYKNPAEVGADRIANAIAAVNMHPGENLIIIDFGTATTFCAVDKNKNYLGGLIFAGLKTAMNALAAQTAKLPQVEIVKPCALVGRTTIESIQSGLYYGNLAAVKYISARIIEENFKGMPAKIIATGGFSNMFRTEKCFDEIAPDLVLYGLKIAADLEKLNDKKNA